MPSTPNARRRRLAGLLPLLAFLPIACAGWQGPPAVSLAGEISNGLAPALVAVETAQGDAAIARGEDPQKTVAAAWAPFWAAWKAWTAAQRAWAAAYDAGAPGLEQAEAAARAAFCAARAALPASAPPELLTIAGLSCALLPAGAAAQDGGAR